ncbi:hypothetical protein [Streptomyces sp. ATCC 21386]|uniref:hypothetical protein n=1 Tax=Streptomyces sp. ATCC 21386 TaxID=2699428 RepID=UPI002044D815|nr:hypothetical protein [Streptomyces sp. ATCC 21386]
MSSALAALMTTGRLLRLRGIAAATITAGVLCQFAQRTDPTAPLLYFTVDSAILAAAVQTWRLVRGPASSMWGDRIRGAAVVGVVLSALVHATVIAPNSPSGTWFGAHDDAWVRTATILLHAVAPVLVVTEFLTSPCVLTRGRREAALLTLWPAAWLAVVGTLAWSGAATMPYLFLRPSQFGGFGVLAVIAVLYGTALALGTVLVAAGHRVQRADRA